MGDYITAHDGHDVNKGVKWNIKGNLDAAGQGVVETEKTATVGDRLRFGLRIQHRQPPAGAAHGEGINPLKLIG